MADAYELIATERFAKDMERLDPVVRGQALRILEAIGREPDGEPLRGELKGLRSRRVRRAWCIVFQVEERRVLLLGGDQACPALHAAGTSVRFGTVRL